MLHIIQEKKTQFVARPLGFIHSFAADAQEESFTHFYPSSMTAIPLFGFGCNLSSSSLEIGIKESGNSVV